MYRPSFATVLSVLFLGYIGHSLWSLYGLFHPATCVPGGDCLRPALGAAPVVQLRVYASTSKAAQSLGAPVLRWDHVDLSVAAERVVEVTLPVSTRNNGSLFVHAVVLPKGSSAEEPRHAAWHLKQTTRMTTFAVPQAETFSLMGNSSAAEKRRATTPVTHWRGVLPLSAVAEPIEFDWHGVPGEVISLLRLDDRRRYYPIFYLDELSFRTRDLVEVTPQTSAVNVTVAYRPVSIGKLRLLITALRSIEQLKQLGFGEKDVDEVKGIFADTHFYLLAVTLFVAAIHLLFDALAFKNDISFWRGRKTMVGLSTRALLWRAFSQTVVLVYLLDEETSLLVSMPAGVGVLIEFWKVTKALKVHVSWRGGVRLGAASDEEAATERLDSQGMRYLAALLVPLCVGGAVYSLLYVPHKSWYSWLVGCLANGVYAFGFLFMLPQLFINYKLKSVAHLPWRAFMYKAFNTFIDDLFAFIIHMPTAHRVACFRDDVVFVVYLYQRYLYPVDRSRVNEFGESFDADAKKQR